MQQDRTPWDNRAARLGYRSRRRQGRSGGSSARLKDQLPGQRWTENVHRPKNRPRRPDSHPLQPRILVRPSALQDKVLHIGNRSHDRGLNQQRPPAVQYRFAAGKYPAAGAVNGSDSPGEVTATKTSPRKEVEFCDARLNQSTARFRRVSFFS